MPTVALAACAAFPDLDDDDRLLVPALAERGITAVPAVWTDPSIDWSAFDAVVIRETWDYSEDRAAFLAWVDQVESVSLLMNAGAVLEWNTDKRYLRELAECGVPVVPTVFLEPGDDADSWAPPAGHADVVVKPAVSAGSRDTMRYPTHEPLDAARAHARDLLGAGRTVMVQPYLDAVDTVGETAVLFIGGHVSHAIRKGPLLQRGVAGETVGGMFVQEEIDRRDPTPEELTVAHQVMRCIPGGGDALLYARVDLIPGEDGHPLLLELELTEPSLFLQHAEGAPQRVADAIALRLGPVPQG